MPVGYGFIWQESGGLCCPAVVFYPADVPVWRGRCTARRVARIASHWSPLAYPGTCLGTAAIGQALDCSGHGVR